MTTFVIMAAGRGTRMGRVGESLHKALVPLDGRAVLSHQLELAPPDAKIVICVGYRSDQIRDYVRFAHPQLGVEFIEVANVDGPGSGPGQSLYEAAAAVEGDMVLTSCDTLWQKDFTMWTGTLASWCGIAPVPAGTPARRWCRVDASPVEDLKVEAVYDKNDSREASYAYVGLARIREDDLELFWDGLLQTEPLAGERQVSGGLAALAADQRLYGCPVRWMDVGDDEAYRRAVAQLSGYDWTKTDQATYVLPRTGRVVKYSADDRMIGHRAARGRLLGDTVPQPIEHAGSMMSYPFIAGVSGYEDAARHDDETTARVVLTWMDKLHGGSTPILRNELQLADQFYRLKTLDRVVLLRPDLARTASDVISRINWDRLVAGCRIGPWHGDLNYGNVVIASTGQVYGIDWREDFAGNTEAGDQRYDLAKLIAGTVVHWDRSQRGDFRPWNEGVPHATYMRNHKMHDRDVEIIGALSLINSAPLHASPLDEILVARGAAWLEEAL